MNQRENHLEVSLLTGGSASDRLRDPAFRIAWVELLDQCSWSTSYQSPAFVAAWFQAYGHRYSPIVVEGSDSHGNLAGLLVLAREDVTGALVMAGTHHAEYQAWLARDGDRGMFIRQAIDALESACGSVSLQFLYAPPGLVSGPDSISSQVSVRMDVEARARPCWMLVPEEIEASLRKKSNRSKLNRIKRLGDFAFERIVSPEAFAAALRIIAPCYDIRQAAEHGGALPFFRDSAKADFHVRLLAENPEQLHVTVITIDGIPRSMHIGVRSGDTVHLAIIAHDPAIAKLSPGKVHLQLLAKMLAEEGIARLDLTPGGDPWKERFATEHDEAAIITLYASAARKAVATGKRRVFRIGGRMLRAIRPAGGRQSVDRLDANSRPADISVVDLPSLESWSGEFSSVCSAQVNNLAHLIAVACTDQRDVSAYLRTAVARLEEGHQSLSIEADGEVAGVAWLRASKDDPDASILYDFHLCNSSGDAARSANPEIARSLLVAAGRTANSGKIAIEIAEADKAVRDIVSRLGDSFNESAVAAQSGSDLQISAPRKMRA